MLPEHELLLDSDDVLLVLGIVVPQLVQDLGFNKALFVESLLVSEHLEGDTLFVLVIVALEDLAKAALAEPTRDLKPVGDVLALFSDVFVFVIIEAVVVDSIRSGGRPFLPLPSLEREPVNRVILDDLRLLYLHEVLREVYHGVPRIHWEHHLLILLIQRTHSSLLHNGTQVAGLALLDQMGRKLRPLIKCGLVGCGCCILDHVSLIHYVVPLDAHQRVFVPISDVIDYGLPLVLQLNRVVTPVGKRTVQERRLIHFELLVLTSGHGIVRVLRKQSLVENASIEAILMPVLRWQGASVVRMLRAVGGGLTILSHVSA